MHEAHYVAGMHYAKRIISLYIYRVSISVEILLTAGKGKESTLMNFMVAPCINNIKHIILYSLFRAS